MRTAEWFLVLTLVAGGCGGANRADDPDGRRRRCDRRRAAVGPGSTLPRRPRCPTRDDRCEGSVRSYGPCGAVTLTCQSRCQEQHLLMLRLRRFRVVIPLGTSMAGRLQLVAAVR